MRDRVWRQIGLKMNSAKLYVSVSAVQTNVFRCIHDTWWEGKWAAPEQRDLRDRWSGSRAERASSNLKTWAPSKKRAENSICNAPKLLSVGACEKYMTALFILHSPFMLESMMASGKRGHTEQRTPIESQCIASLISYFYADTSITMFWWEKGRRKKNTIKSKWALCVFWLNMSVRMYARREKPLVSPG